MIKKRYLVALSAFSAAIAACGSDTTSNGGTGATPGVATGGSGPAGGTSGGTTPTGGTTGGSNPTGGTGGGTGGGTTGGTGGGGTGGGGTGGDGGSGAAKCVQGVQTTTQVPRILNRQYDAAVRDLLGVTAVGTDIPSANLVEDSEGPMTSYMWKAYLDVGSKIATAVMTGANKAKFMECDAAAAGCLETSIKNFGRKAFRRPMTDAEVTNFVQKLNAVMPGGTPDQIAETALWTFLVSPSFLLIPEMDASTMEAGAIKLSQYEVAARLSFLLWGSVPDKDLSDAADAGMLGTKEQILTQAQRMIAVREKTGPMISAFHRVAWAKDNNTSTSHWWKMDHEANSKYVGTAKLEYRAELDKFFEEVAFTNGGFKDLFLSPIAFVNQNNAEIYGLPKAMYGTDLVKVTLDAEQRPGFMTRVGFLSSFAHGTETAPILRGAFVTVNMIGVDPGPPMIDPSQIPQLMGDFTTNREYVETLTTSQASCSGCHTPYVNPPGFVLESYDEVGAWQTVDPKGGMINAVADVTFSETNTKTISTPKQMMEEIANTPFAKHMYAEQWVQFATGRYPNDNDACTVDALDMKLSTDGYSVLTLLADITQADSFRLRVKATP